MTPVTALQQRILDYLRAHPWQCRATIVEAVQISAAEDGLETPDPAAIHHDLQTLVVRKFAQTRSGVARAEYAVAEAVDVQQARPDYKPAVQAPVRLATPFTPNPAKSRAERVLSALQASPEGLSVGALSKLLTLSHAHVRAALRQLGDRVANSAAAGEHGVYHAAEHANPRGDERGRTAAHDETPASQATVDNGASAPDVQPPAQLTRSAAVEPAPSAEVPGAPTPGADVSELATLRELIAELLDTELGEYANGAGSMAPIEDIIGRIADAVGPRATPNTSAPALGDVPSASSRPIPRTRQLQISRLAVWSDGVIEIMEPDNRSTLILADDAQLLARYLAHINEIPNV